MIFSDGFSWILAVMVMAWFTRPQAAPPAPAELI
jgi:hypothetical protein